IKRTKVNITHKSPIPSTRTQESGMAALFEPFTLRGITFTNRIAVAPMCQYMAKEGVPGDWHLVHLGQFAQARPGLILIEATGITPEGRITPSCTGLYSDACEEAFARILSFCRS